MVSCCHCLAEWSCGGDLACFSNIFVEFLWCSCFSGTLVECDFMYFFGVRFFFCVLVFFFIWGLFCLASLGLEIARMWNQ
ncbi:hypothetical protein C2G38_362420 [Gigaspora rosea]|uniref:Uncharacterized protein n=1 Tax=Gigaspora rosea TaxID=44941 RepID=A0A397VXC7_9GLOM|nr:hypothetical protein C2G38_362420 [Gigaspora rosea]